MLFNIFISHRVEDHDDLMPIFNRQNDVLTSMYGDFFLAELIEAQDEENKCLVADVSVNHMIIVHPSYCYYPSHLSVVKLLFTRDGCLPLTVY